MTPTQTPLIPNTLPETLNLTMSSESKLDLKSVADIAAGKLKFFIPDYQRGYRWEVDQVKDLLTDLVEFFQSGKPLYCLQPLVVVPRDKHPGEWEVVDGQQRLTTLFLILANLADPNERPRIEIRYQRHEEHFKDSSNELFDILEHVRKGDGAAEKIPDLHYIRKADVQIKTFLIKLENRDILKNLPNPASPEVSFIWYELPEGDAIAAFTRLNAGKIPLTDVELIRALFLRGNTELSEAERLMIATVWDQMEKRLSEGDFWCFAAPAGYAPENRIELVFQMEAGKRLGQEDHELFNHVKKCIERFGLRRTWEELEKAFAALEEWYEDHALFHLIGYLSNASGGMGTPVWDLYHGYWLSGGFTTKNGFNSALKGIIKKLLMRDQDVEACLDGLKYGNVAIKPLLLCFNLASLLSERQGTVRFSFHAFRDQNWDVEHIHARATEDPKGKELDGFLEMYRSLFKRHHSDEASKLFKELGGSLDPNSKTDADAKIALYQKCDEAVKNEASADSLSEKDRESLENLTLLDSKTNRGYKNASYLLKRAWILDTENQDIYIPPCTRNVFTKSYTTDANELLRWGLRDGEAYVAAMAEVLKAFFQEAKFIGQSKPKAPETSTTSDRQDTFAEMEHVHGDGGSQGTRIELDGEILGFLDLLTAYGQIEIPQIQRDYAQGRGTQVTVRTAFLDSIFKAWETGGNLNLDFVYGTGTKDKVFHPIDGQQRLTTLFLLHWVAFWKAGKLEDFREIMLLKNGASRFRYRVRPGAERFFPALLKHPMPEPSFDGALNDELPKQIWFSKNWLNDPTVRGALVMLDSIKAKFDFFPNDLEKRLGKIQMEVLVLPKEMPADEIYLKMNARGKPLTDFEKFKAWLVRPESPLKRDDWKLRLDREWLEFFWGKSKTDKHRASAVSVCFFNTMLALAINAQAGLEPNPGETGEVFADRINGWIKLGQSYQVNEWEKLFGVDAIRWVFDSLDNFQKRACEIEKLMASGDWKLKEKLVTSHPDLELSFSDRCWLHAVTLFCHGKCGEDREWFRVARNLISNTDLSNIIYLPQTIRSLNKLAERMKESVLAGLATLDDDEIQTFLPKDFAEQLEEERKKAQLLRDTGADWQVIRIAEKQPYLKGQIEVLLSGSADGKITMDAGGFSKRWETFEVLMDREKMNPCIEGDISDPERLDRLVIRAVLAKCEPVSSAEVVWLPGMAESSWGKALKRDADIKQFRAGLMKVIDELIGSASHGRRDQLVKGLDQMASHPSVSPVSWMRILIEHGEEILKHSEDWKLKRYAHRRTGWENTFFVFQKTNRNRYDLEDILIGEEFDVRNELLAELVETGWAQSGASKMTSNGRTIFSGHLPELQRDGRKMVFFYQSIELDEIGQKQRISFMTGDRPRKIQDVLDELTQHGMPV